MQKILTAFLEQAVYVKAECIFILFYGVQKGSRRTKACFICRQEENTIIKSACQDSRDMWLPSAYSASCTLVHSTFSSWEDSGCVGCFLRPYHELVNRHPIGSPNLLLMEWTRTLASRLSSSTLPDERCRDSLLQQESNSSSVFFAAKILRTW